MARFQICAVHLLVSLFVGLFSPQCAFAAESGDESFGADEKPLGEPMGGGMGYSRIIDKPAVVVKNLDGLLKALQDAKTGDTVYVDDAVEIDLSGKQNIVIPGGVTLASGRGRDGSEGALLLATPLKTSPLFETGGPGVRVTGLRLRGPDGTRRTEELRKLYKEGKYYSIPTSDGIVCTHPDLEVDNCELSAWSHAAVFLKQGATDAHIHHNYMHHNQRSGLGYGVCLDRSNALVEGNLFDWCRHHVAATGRPGTSYEARHNLVLENANGHSFDMHGGRDRKDGTDIAGDSVKIHHNTVRATSVRAVVIRGVPRESAEIHHNWFLQADEKSAVRQTNATGNMNVYRNQYGPDRVLKD